MNIIILGANSDIARELTPRFMVAGDSVFSWTRTSALPVARWDAIICAIGVLDPIGEFFSLDPDEWEANVDSNALLPLRLLRTLWPMRRPGASVCFFSGAGVGRPAQSYSAYSASKIMLLKMTELLDDEYADTKFFILGPGMVRTKIQQQTLAAGARAMNYERVRKFMDEGDELHGAGTSHDRIYECLRWCMAQPKDVIGGRNIYVPLDTWGDDMAAALKADAHMFKFRRQGDERKFK